MAGQFNLNVRNLEALDVPGLAGLLLTLSQGDAGAR